MVDYIQPQLRRHSARHPYDLDPSYPNPLAPQSTRSRRSSVSSFTESEFSVFSDTSVASSQTSASSQLSAGWGSSPPDDSDEDNYSSLYEDSSESEFRPNLIDTTRNNVGLQKKEQALYPAATAAATSVVHGSRASLSLIDTAASRAANNSSANAQHLSHSNQATKLYPSQASRASQPGNTSSPPHGHDPSAASSHPRRTTVDASWSKPTLVTQHERRLNFVENLVDSATQLVALIWPMAMTEVCNPGRQPGTPVITLRFFIRETLRRSRTSFSTLQVAMYYLALLNYGGQISKCDRTPNQALHCGRRMFLASLILASKYLQDRNYFTKAWSRISNLSIQEINRNEMALLSALEYKLHINPCSFQKWTDGISKCTAAVQRGIDCPWVEVLMVQNMWRPIASSAKLTVGTPEIVSEHQKSVGITPCRRSSTVPEHRLGLAGLGQSVCPTKPFPLPVRSCTMGKPSVQWQGMASHLQPQYRTASANLTQGVSQYFSQDQEMPDEPNPIEDADASQSSLLSPPKTPESEETTRLPIEGVESIHQRPPPTPKEPLVSLNTTPDSNDGVSTFGNYLGPPSEHSPSSSDAEGGPSHLASRPSVARSQADTLGTYEQMANGPQSAGTSWSSVPTLKSLELNSPCVEHPASLSVKKSCVKRGIAAAVHADLDSSETFMDVEPDTTPSHINTCVQERTRRLLKPRTLNTLGNDSSSSSRSAVIEDGDVDDRSCRSDSNHWKSVKHEKCQRRKRPAGSFSGDHGLSCRTKKILRA